MKKGDAKRGAIFSDADRLEDAMYRYKLWRMWQEDLPSLAFIMLNPSTADHRNLDPTCTRCKNYALDWGYGELIVGNIFALRSTSPNELYKHSQPVGPENDEYLDQICREADTTIVAWGNHGDYMDRGQEVMELLDNCDTYALDTTDKNQPNHPLYQPKDAKPEKFTMKEEIET